MNRASPSSLTQPTGTWSFQCTLLLTYSVVLANTYNFEDDEFVHPKLRAQLPDFNHRACSRLSPSPAPLPAPSRLLLSFFEACACLSVAAPASSGRRGDREARDELDVICNIFILSRSSNCAARGAVFKRVLNFFLMRWNCTSSCDLFPGSTALCYRILQAVRECASVHKSAGDDVQLASLWVRIVQKNSSLYLLLERSGCVSGSGLWQSISD